MQWQAELAATGFADGLMPHAAGIDGATLWRGRFDGDRLDPAWLARLGLPLPPSLLGAHPRRQADYLAGRAVARHALAGFGHTGAPPMGPDKLPVWPGGLIGSISHARGHMACLVLPDTGVCPGLDIEAVASGSALEAILSHCLTDAERAALPAPDMTRHATRLFSAKEALFKALHPSVGRYFGFDAAELVPGNRLALRLTGDLTPHLRAGTVFTLHSANGPDWVMTWLVAPRFPLGT
ncbi:4'-phosphopantetheinyl transferase family protein [Gemmobacter denitrificans]|uniref:Enterobactin synthase component D n=1 Tax=Gemmobacter denitrificans TaxID=3123040 RepID=A0ABU8BSW8_9RHOB